MNKRRLFKSTAFLLVLCMLMNGALISADATELPIGELSPAVSGDMLDEGLEGEPFDEGPESESLDGGLGGEPLDEGLGSEPLDAGFDNEPLDEKQEDEPIDDELEGESIDDELEGESIDDELEGEPIDDELEGESIDDELEGEPIDDELEGEPFDEGLDDESLDDELFDEYLYDEEYAAMLEEAKAELYSLVEDSLIIAVISREECEIYNTPSYESDIYTYLPIGRQIQIQGIVFDEYDTPWEYVKFLQDGVACYGYLMRSDFVCSDERFLAWEDTYGMNPSLMMRTFAFGPTANTDLNIEAFPDSYKAALYALKEQHPNWTFIKMETGLDWNTVVDNEMKPGRSLINSSSPSYLQNGIYGPNWAYATRGALEHYLDPRNGLNEDGIFQFELLTYNSSYHTKDALQLFLNSTFMSGIIPGDSVHPVYSITYADLIYGTGSQLNVSPFHLACRIYQEQGAGNSPLISGTYSGYESYYNYFNIGATGSGTTEVIVNGLKRAKQEGWNNRYDSIYKGASFIKANYIGRGQDTLYLQKFDVDNSDNSLYSHQYMQNIKAPLSEGKNVGKLYRNANSYDNKFVFKIPVFNNMPATACALPTLSYDVVLPLPEGYSGTEVYLDGILYNGVNNAGQLCVPAIDGNAKTAIMYKYNDAGVPVGMYVWTLQHNGLVYDVTPQPELQDLLTYHGFSIRITGKSGIRFKTGISTTTRAQLLSGGVNGYTLKEYGTLVMNQANRAQYAMVKGGTKVSNELSYGINENGVMKDLIFESIDNRYRYTLVLVGLPASQYKTEFAFRGYIILTKNGVDTIIYGPPVAKSIYNLAGMAINTGNYAVGTESRAFLDQLISDADALEAASQQTSGDTAGGTGTPGNTAGGTGAPGDTAGGT